MAANTKIEWCDHTFNPWRGCQKVAPGCKHCYAETRSKRFAEDFAGQRIRLSDAGWKEPLRWNRKAEQAGERRRVFCASLADVFEDWKGPIVDHDGIQLWICNNCNAIEPMTAKHGGHLPTCECDGPYRSLAMSDLRRDLFTLIDKTPWLDWQLLTKRPENIRRMWGLVDQFTASDETMEANLPRAGKLAHRPNVWLLPSVSEQETADRNIPELLNCRDLVPVLGVSAEPLLGPVALEGPTHNWLPGTVMPDGTRSPLFSERYGYRGKLDWVIVGGESGPGARPCYIDHVRSLVDQCRRAGLPCFVKQLGRDPMELAEHENTIDSHIGLNDKKGGDPSEWPEDIRVREFPAAGA